VTARTLPVTPAERACATVLRAWRDWHETPPEPRGEAFEAMLNLGDWLADNGIVEGECLALTPAGAALLARVEAAERPAYARAVALIDALNKDAGGAVVNGALHAAIIAEANAKDAARLAGTTPIDAPPAKEPT